MEVLIEIKKYFRFLGIKSDKKSNFSATNWMIVSLCVICLIPMSFYIVLESNSLMSSGNTFFGMASATLNAVTLSSNAWKKSKIFELFRRFEEMIMKRKLLFYCSE